MVTVGGRRGSRVLVADALAQEAAALAAVARRQGAPAGVDQAPVGRQVVAAAGRVREGGEAALATAGFSRLGEGQDFGVQRLAEAPQFLHGERQVAAEEAQLLREHLGLQRERHHERAAGGVVAELEAEAVAAGAARPVVRVGHLSGTEIAGEALGGERPGSVRRRRRPALQDGHGALVARLHADHQIAGGVQEDGAAERHAQPAVGHHDPRGAPVETVRFRGLKEQRRPG